MKEFPVPSWRELQPASFPDESVDDGPGVHCEGEGEAEHILHHSGTSLRVPTAFTDSR